MVELRFVCELGLGRSFLDAREGNKGAGIFGFENGGGSE
jgi:hypothetical protein